MIKDMKKEKIAGLSPVILCCCLLDNVLLEFQNIARKSYAKSFVKYEYIAKFCQNLDFKKKKIELRALQN